jgi:tRNA(Glu) U13 pseudouridine synthase TruD
MTALEIILTVLVSVVFLWGVWCWYNWDKWMRGYIDVADKYIAEVREGKKMDKRLKEREQYITSLRQTVEDLMKDRDALTAELDLYKNHEAETRLASERPHPGAKVKLTTAGCAEGYKAIVNVVGCDTENGDRYQVEIFTDGYRAVYWLVIEEYADFIYSMDAALAVPPMSNQEAFIIKR